MEELKEKEQDLVDFSLGLILDKQRRVGMLHKKAPEGTAKGELYQLQFDVIGADLEEWKKGLRINDEGNGVFHSVTLHPDTMEALVHLYLLKRLQDQGEDVEDTVIAGFSVHTRSKKKGLGVDP